MARLGPPAKGLFLILSLIVFLARFHRCAQARQALQTYSDGGRIYKYNEKGERTFMEENEIDAARGKAQRDVDEACKKA